MVVIKFFVPLRTFFLLLKSYKNRIPLIKNFTKISFCVFMYFVWLICFCVTSQTMLKLSPILLYCYIDLTWETLLLTNIDVTSFLVQQNRLKHCSAKFIKQILLSWFILVAAGYEFCYNEYKNISSIEANFFTEYSKV